MQKKKLSQGGIIKSAVVVMNERTLADKLLRFEQTREMQRDVTCCVQCLCEGMLQKTTQSGLNVLNCRAAHGDAQLKGLDSH